MFLNITECIFKDNNSHSSNCNNKYFCFVLECASKQSTMFDIYSCQKINDFSYHLVSKFVKRHTLEELVAYTQVPPLHEGRGSKPTNQRFRVSNDQSSVTIIPYLPDPSIWLFPPQTSARHQNVLKWKTRLTVSTLYRQSPGDSSLCLFCHCHCQILEVCSSHQ